MSFRSMMERRHLRSLNLVEDIHFHSSSLELPIIIGRFRVGIERHQIAAENSFDDFTQVGIDVQLQD
jgi:hypothetical protein